MKRNIYIRYFYIELSWGDKDILVVNKRRSEIDIIYDFLSNTQEDIKKTRLMYSLNMAYSQFNTYLDFLLEKEIIGKKGCGEQGNLYYITDKGKILLNSLDNITKFLE
jgi:predicted transcriptional regulator